MKITDFPVLYLFYYTHVIATTYQDTLHYCKFHFQYHLIHQKYNLAHHIEEKGYHKLLFCYDFLLRRLLNIQPTHPRHPNLQQLQFKPYFSIYA